MLAFLPLFVFSLSLSPSLRACPIALFQEQAPGKERLAAEPSYERFKLPADTKSEGSGADLLYALRTPDLEPNAEQPPVPRRVVLALPPGAQTAPMADWIASDMASSAFGDSIVVSPIAPNGQSFYADASPLLPPFLDEIERRFGVPRGEIHLAGVSNGGRSALHLALNHPERFASLSVLPGVLPHDDDAKRIARLRVLPVALWVGEDDAPGWHEGAKRIQKGLTEAGGDVTLRVVSGVGHVLPPVHWTEVRMHMDRATIASLLDDFHDAAARADLERYFGHFAPNGVFIGTDATERWPVEEFRAFCEPYFKDSESAWV
ncbi:MAG: nuclear transport factor 2 family protein, partial [Planctomycetota bacterium]